MFKYFVTLTIKENGNIHSRYFSKKKDALDFKQWAEIIPEFINVKMIEA